jgi:hypothetical protein
MFNFRGLGVLEIENADGNNWLDISFMAGHGMVMLYMMLIPVWDHIGW